MKFALESNAELRIHAYDTGVITLAVPGGLEMDLPVESESGLCRVQESFILTARQLITDWQVDQLGDLSVTHLEEILALEPELVLLGTGANLRFPSAELMAPLHQASIGIEVMDTAAACRTFNILVGEGRHVAAALLMI